MAYDIAVLPGDGIGTELMDAVVPLAERAGDAYGAGIEPTRFDWGAEHYLETGAVMPDDALDRLAEFDAILLGAMGHPDVDNYAISAAGHHKIRKGFDQYVNLRPVHLFEGIESPLRGYGADEIDIAWYRENSEGEYLDVGGRLARGGASELAVQSAVYTRKGVERIARAAFEAATEREGLVTNVTKANALPHGPGFWDEVVEEVSEDYPGVTLEHRYADAANMALVTEPEAFDVIVASNLFSDILTEVAAAVTGGLGLAGSSNENPENDDPDMFEPIHGTAPDIEGRGIANPIGTVLSAAMLFENLGEDAAGAALRDAVREQLADPNGPRTPDIGGDAGTEAVARDLADRL